MHYLLFLNQTAYLDNQGRLSHNKEGKSRALWSSVMNRHDVDSVCPNPKLTELFVMGFVELLIYI